MFISMHMIISSEQDKDYQHIKESLLKFNPKFSISPSREYAGLKDHSEFYMTSDIIENQIQPLLDALNNDWDIDEENDYYECYGFNTKMFDPLVYYISIQLYR